MGIFESKYYKNPDEDFDFDPPMECEELKPEYGPKAWRLRPCNAFLDEYKECKRIKGRFQQYWTVGEFADCSQWKVDYQNCLKFRKHRDLDAMRAVIESDEKRVAKRLAATIANDVWKLRKEPLPREVWMRPLPDWFDKSGYNESSPLYQEQLRRDAKFKEYEEKRKNVKNLLKHDSNLPGEVSGA